jgi:hypothetical protein
MIIDYGAIKDAWLRRLASEVPPCREAIDAR